MMIKPYFFITSILFVVPLSYYAGRLGRTCLHSSATLLGAENSTLSSPDDFIRAADVRRYELKMSSSQASQQAMENTCPTRLKILLEEIFFSEPFRKYGERAQADDHDGFEDEDEDGDSDDCDDDDSDADTANITENHDPVAAQIFMSLDGLQSKYLEDMERVRQSILETVWEASSDLDLAIISLHCQQQLFSIFCVAVLGYGGHMTVFTDSKNSHCSVEVLVSTQDDILGLLPILEGKFAQDQEHRTLYRHLSRGWRTFAGRWDPIFAEDLNDLFLDNNFNYYYKNQIGHIKSGFQHIHVVEGLNAIYRSLRGYEESLMTERGTYSSLNPDLFLPNRKLFLDGVIQSSTLGDEAYHEALVHPAMFAHRYGPKRVAVIGGGEGATLREVLKHKSVEVCTMVEIDPGIVKAAREWLPSMNDCSDFGNGNCFDEDRTDLICEDAFEWFLSRFSNSENQQDFRTDQFDVIIMDALDPEDTIEFAVKLYRDEQFWATLKNALTQDGILVMQLGQSPDHRHPSEQFGRFHNRASLFQTVEKIGFRATFVYYETHCDFEFPWSYLVACISEECVHEWHQNEAELNLRIHERILPSMSGLPTLKYFDGATMQAYRIPRKEWEIVYCRRDPRPEECDLLLNVKEAASWFEAFGIVSLLEKRFVAKKDMKKGSAISWADTSFVDKSSEENAFASADLARAAESIKEALKACNLTSSVTRNNLSGKISPFWDRHAYIKHVELLTRGISRGEQLACL